VSPFDVNVIRVGSMSSKDGMRGDAYSRCAGTRRIQFEPDQCYLDFRDWRTRQKLHDSLSGSRYECVL